MTMHVAIFPQWECQLDCAYCSIRHSQIDRSVQGVPWQRWAETIPGAVGWGGTVDIAGGEPFLYEGLVNLLHAFGRAGLSLAITTNGKATEAISRFCQEKPRGCACLNVSDHAGNPEAHENIIKMRQAGYRVNVHRVDHPAAGTHELDAQLITYQDWEGGKAVDGVSRICTAGMNHWVAGPNGDLWRCIVAAQTGQPAQGNLFTREIKRIERQCDFGCSSCYTGDPLSWQIQMTELA